MKSQIALFFVLIFLNTSCDDLAKNGLNFIYLTYEQEDLETSININFRKGERDKGFVYFDTVSHDGDMDKYTYRAESRKVAIPDLEDYEFFETPISGLTPGQVYYFIVTDGERKLSNERSFRMIDSSKETIRMVNGGDIFVGPATKKLMESAGEENPDLFLVGGDIAYANGDKKLWYLWRLWFKIYEKEMRTPDGHMVPIVATVGNHEITGEDHIALPYPRKALYYEKFFAQGGSMYFKRTIGDRLSLYILDSGHVIEHAGAQSEWLEDELEDDLTTLKFAMYHAPLYPAVRGFNYGEGVRGREAWEPLFSQYGIHTALEHHDHAFKRTPLIKNGVVSNDSSGVLYLGDGAMGVFKLRDIPDENRWWIEKSKSVHHYWVIDIEEDIVRYTAKGKKSDDIYDSLTRAINANQ